MMETNNLIHIEHLCVNCDVEVSFINSLNEYGLIDVIIQEENKYISNDQLKDVERAIRFYYELNINMEGIDVILNLLKQITVLQQELKIAKERLNMFENL